MACATALLAGGLALWTASTARASTVDFATLTPS
jgi:hypothetical protein